MKRLSPSKRTLGYWRVLAAALLVAIVAGWTPLAAQIDDYAYDWMFRLHPPAPAPPHCLILAIDDATFSCHGRRRAAIAACWPRRSNCVKPRATRRPSPSTWCWPIPEDPAEDQRLDARHAGVPEPGAGCASGIAADGKIRSRSSAATPPRSVTTAPTSCRATASRAQIPLEERTDTERHWALALEAFRLARGAPIVESPRRPPNRRRIIPAARSASHRPSPARALHRAADSRKSR